MVKKIISGGQTGVDQAALDVAIKLDIPHGGWIPAGRKTDAGFLPSKYRLRELPTSDWPQVIERNVIDSDGTLIISRGELIGGSELTRKTAMRKERPWLHVDLGKVNAFEAAGAIQAWITKNGIDVLNVTGPRASDDPEIYKVTTVLLQAAFYLEITEKSMPDPVKATPTWPDSVADAVGRLISDLPLKDKIAIARMEEADLIALRLSLGEYIRDKFGLWSGNKPLMEACRTASGKQELHAEDASTLIITALWKRLRETHLMRAVK
jgi:hypothetical protein